MPSNKPDVSDAVDQASRLDQIGFPEFTSKLISDTFDAIVSSMIRQQQAYADLVEKVAMTIEDFENEAVTDADIDGWLASTFSGEKQGETFVEAGNDISSAQVNQIHTELGAAAEKKESVTLPEKDSGTKLTEEQVTGIRSLVRRTLAEPRLAALQEIVEQGVVRLVVDDGTIETDLKFQTYSSQSASSRKSSYDRDSWGFQAGGSYTSGLFGISASGGMSSMSVSTTNESERAYSSANTTIKGHVKINVRGDYQPLRVPPKEEQTTVAVTPPQ